MRKCIKGGARMKHRVAWKNKTTGASGHGEWSENENIISAWVDYGNKKHPKIDHVIETNKQERDKQ